MVQPIRIRSPRKESPEPPLLLSCRLSFFVLTFFASLFVTLLRSNVSIALVCMVKPLRHTATTSVTSENVTVKPTLQLTDLANATTETLEEMLVADEAWGQCHYDYDVNLTNQPITDGGEFEWDKNIQANILAAFFYGSFFTNIIGGRLADRYGGTNFLLGTVAVIGILTVLNPIAAVMGPWYLFVVRFLQGMAQGSFMPLIAVLAARWSGSAERGFLLGITFCGLTAGIFVTNPLCAWLCKMFGWEYIFYIPGALTLLWCIWAYFFLFDWPEKHSRISEEELKYLEAHAPVQPGVTRKLVVPYKSILLSVPVNVVHFVHFCVLWGILTIAMFPPLFFKEIFKMDVSTNGNLTAIPFLGMVIIHIISGKVFDFMRLKEWFSVTNLRKIFNTIGTGSFALCVLLMGLITCDDKAGIVAIFSGMSFVELAFTGGYLFSVLELAPRYAGIITGIMNTYGVLPGFFCPLLQATLTQSGTREGWLMVFYIAGAVMGAGCIVYVIFGSSELQPWAASKPKVNADVELAEATKPMVCTDTEVDAVDAGSSPPEDTSAIDDGERL